MSLAALTEPSHSTPNDLAGEGKIMIPTTPPSYLDLKFNTKAYRLMESMLGVSHFGQTKQTSLSLQWLAVAIFAGSRTYVNKKMTGVSLEDLNAALDDLTFQESLILWKAVCAVYEASMGNKDDLVAILITGEKAKPKEEGEEESPLMKPSVGDGG